ncbi:MAG: tRNA 5-methoxyuridine(34)/uridine 5-oxyacetic acid(34) synthase CmoB [Lysobacterales bacterium]
MIEALLAGPSLDEALQRSPIAQWQTWVQDPQRFARLNAHGDLPRWQNALEAMPDIDVEHFDLGSSAVTLKGNAGAAQRDQLGDALMQLHPWRKGPFSLFGIDIDTEWRSDWKWDRIAPYLDDLSQRCVLDIGCGSGYHLWRMLGAGADLALGIDPTVLFNFQFAALKQFLPHLPAAMLPVGLETLPDDMTGFDTVFSMGILYHRRSPLAHLEQIRTLLRPGGQAILETLVVAGDDRQVLVPEGRYAKMRNVWFIPSTDLLARWLRRCGFVDVEWVDMTATTTDEQRSTPWMTFDSLKTFLDPEDPTKTVEGYPAPVRAVFSCRRSPASSKSSASSKKRNLSRKAD